MLNEHYSFKLYYSNSPQAVSSSFFYPNLSQFRKSFEHLQCKPDSNPLSSLVTLKKMYRSLVEKRSIQIEAQALIKDTVCLLQILKHLSCLTQKHMVDLYLKHFKPRTARPEHKTSYRNRKKQLLSEPAVVLLLTETTQFFSKLLRNVL